jgi:dihydrofolate reductase
MPELAQFHRLPNLHAIFSLTIDGCMGKAGDLCIKNKHDLAFFKRMTNNDHIIMGRKTFSSLPGLLPNRTHHVLSGSQDIDGSMEDGVFWYNRLTTIIDFVKTHPYEHFWVIGGPGLIEMLSPWISELTITHFLEFCGGDVKISKHMSSFLYDKCYVALFANIGDNAASFKYIPKY